MSTRKLYVYELTHNDFYHHQRTSPKKWSKDNRTKIAKFLSFVPEVALINLSRNNPGQLVLVFTLDWREWFSKIYPVFLWNQAKKLSRWRMRGGWIFLLLASPRHGLPTAAQANRLPGRSVDFVAQVINICIKSDARILEEIATFQNQGDEFFELRLRTTCEIVLIESTSLSRHS